MSLSKNLINARHHLVFLLGLSVAFGIVFSIEQRQFTHDLAADLRYSEQIPAPKPRPLTAQERRWAEVAWQYFANNTQASGLVNSVDGYPSTTLWDTASYLMGLIAARRLDLINASEFEQRLSSALDALAQLPLYDQQLPNKAYDTRSLAMVNYDNSVNERGIGWSAIDIGRLLVPFNILVWDYPSYTDQLNRVLARWDLAPLLQRGLMYGATIANEQTQYVQEGRIGYEEYAAKSLSLMGQDVSQALRYTDFLVFEQIDGVEVPTDSRDPSRYKAHNYVVSESYILDGLEFGWDRISHEFAWRVYQAQYARYQRTGLLTAVSEDNIDRPPYFVYNTVFSDGKHWNAVGDDGSDAAQYKTLSTKASFGWYALYRDQYSQQLLTEASKLFDPDKGWYSGKYENFDEINQALTANTNGIILESLLYIQQGQLLNIGRIGPVQLAQKEE
ncbi:DUF3131 domain-containing protein [Ferrimonas senticii]|uniref:DUF3131 domain-containing protein n=1 Tax=Ferrimonas senticii TaxID=394566 RepID=UPI0004020764|nr:DUF3131 domain-containing protein [Ferrimonas senticii]